MVLTSRKLPLDEFSTGSSKNKSQLGVVQKRLMLGNTFFARI
jgi:hypothetical protein